MLPLYTGLLVLLTAVLAGASLALLLERRGPGQIGHRIVSRTFAGWLGPRAVTGWTWVHLAALLAVGYALVAGFDLATGLYGCAPGGVPADLVGLRGSGGAFWAGGNPFVVADCGVLVLVPYGLAAVALDAVGSLGGAAGIVAVWGVVALALVPLVWFLADEDRRYAALLLAVSPIYFPLIAGEIDGATNAIVPVTVLLAILLARRRPGLGAAVGGLLSSARFPSLFAVLSTAGSQPRRFATAAVGLAAFLIVSALAYARWGSAFVNTVFLSQTSRHAYSLNAFGILLNANALPGGTALPLLQAAATVGIAAAAFLLVRAPVRSAAIVLTGVALLTQFLSYPILLWLIPVVLVGPRERAWLWGISVVGSLNAILALFLLGWGNGVYWPTDLLDALLTGLLVGLFVDLWRGARNETLRPVRVRPPAPDAAPSR
ncbi:MAG: hypothetical protein ACLQD8_05600 [Thermoplasmata archaeon]